MSKTKRWQGGEREIKPRIEDDFLDLDDPNYILTPAEYELQKKKQLEEKENKENDEEPKKS